MGKSPLKKAVKLYKAIIKIDLNTTDLANAICDIIISCYGKHNFKAFKEVVNERLK